MIVVNTDSEVGTTFPCTFSVGPPTMIGGTGDTKLHVSLPTIAVMSGVLPPWFVGRNCQMPQAAVTAVLPVFQTYTTTALLLFGLATTLITLATRGSAVGDKVVVGPNGNVVVVVVLVVVI
jgi:hypothetical protein